MGRMRICKAAHVAMAPRSGTPVSWEPASKTKEAGMSGIKRLGLRTESLSVSSRAFQFKATKLLGSVIR